MFANISEQLKVAFHNGDYANAANSDSSEAAPELRCAMQIKVFEGHRVELVEEAANYWLKAHPMIEVLKIEPTFPGSSVSTERRGDASLRAQICPHDLVS
jgi:hypothetical protein